jgi:hypothetical protein
MRDRIRDLMPAFYDEDIDDEDIGVADAAAGLWEADAFNATAQHTATFRHWLTDDDTEVAAAQQSCSPGSPPLRTSSTASRPSPQTTYGLPCGRART